MKKTPLTKLREYVGKGKDAWSFKTLELAQKYIRANGTPDYIAIDGVLFTMEEYDMDGTHIIYANRRNELVLEVCTHNRYKDGFGDAILEMSPAYSTRNGFVYAD